MIVLYAGCISLGSVFKVTGASSWFADQIMMLVAPLGLNSGVGLVILMWKKFSSKEKKMIKTRGYIERYVEDYDSSYRITKKLIDDGRKHLILKDIIDLNVPIRIFHGICRG